MFSEGFSEALSAGSLDLGQVEVPTVPGEPHLLLRLTPVVWVALPLADVQETVSWSWSRLTPLPNVMPALLGLVEHRSQVFWVMDLPQRLGWPPIAGEELTVAIVQRRGLRLGLAVERIGQVVRWRAEDICAPEATVLPAEMGPVWRGWAGEPPVYLLSIAALVGDVETGTTEERGDVAATET